MVMRAAGITTVAAGNPMPGVTGTIRRTSRIYALASACCAMVAWMLWTSPSSWACQLGLPDPEYFG